MINTLSFLMLRFQQQHSVRRLSSKSKRYISSTSERYSVISTIACRSSVAKETDGIELTVRSIVSRWTLTHKPCGIRVRTLPVVQTAVDRAVVGLGALRSSVLRRAYTAVAISLLHTATTVDARVRRAVTQIYFTSFSEEPSRTRHLAHSPSIAFGTRAQVAAKPIDALTAVHTRGFLTLVHLLLAILTTKSCGTLARVRVVVAAATCASVSTRITVAWTRVCYRRVTVGSSITVETGARVQGLA